MSTDGIESVLSRAMSDAAFAELLFSEPEKALAVYDLTAEEAASLRSIPRADLAAAVQASPEERKSFLLPAVHQKIAGPRQNEAGTLRTGEAR